MKHTGPVTEVSRDKAAAVEQVVSRRRLGALLGGGTMMAAIAALPVRAAEKDLPKRAAKACPAMSQAVITGAVAASMTAYRHTESHAPVGNDYRNMAYAFTILFNHFDEVGLTATIEARMKSPTFRQGPPDAERMAAVRSAVVGTKLHGIERYVDRLENSWKMPTPELDAVLNKKGVHGLYALSIQQMVDAAAKLDRMPPFSTGLYGGASVRPVQFIPCDVIQEALDIIVEGVIEGWEWCIANPCICAAIALGAAALYLLQQAEGC